MAGRRGGGWIGLVIAIVILLGLLWVGYWYAAQSAVGTAIARHASAPADGSGIACSNPAVGGFPLVVDIRCDRVTYRAGNGRIAAELGGVEATAPLYRPGAIDATIGAPLVVNAPAMGVALTASWSLGTANASAWLGGLTGVGASFVSLTADNDGRVAGIPIDSMAAAKAAASIAPAGGGSYTISADAMQLKLTRTDGSSLPNLDGEGRVTLLDVGDSLGTDPGATILAWARNGGTARIDRLKIAGEGAIVTSDGSLRLSDDGRLNGSIQLRWNDIAALADLIEAILPGTRERFETPLQGLNAVSVPAETDDGPLRQTTLTFTEGVIWLGIFPLPIDPLPPIRF